MKKVDKKFLNIAYLLFFIGLAIFALYYCFKNIKFDEFVNSLKSADYSLIIISALAGVVATVARAVRWKTMIVPLGYKPSLFNTYNSLMVCYMANLAMPRVGELIRCTTLNETDKIPVNSLLGTVVSERVFDFFCLIVIFTLTFFLKMELFLNFFTDKIAPQWKPMFENASVSTFCIIIFVAIALFSGVYFLMKYLLKKPYMHKIRKLLLGLADGLKSIFKIKQKFLFLICTFAIWFCYWLSGYLIFKALPLTAEFTVFDGLFFLSLGTLGWVVPSPGGFGTFHFIVALGLTMYGIPFEPEGISIATLSHESQLLGMVLFGIIALISVSLIKLKLKQK